MPFEYFIEYNVHEVEVQVPEKTFAAIIDAVNAQILDPIIQENVCFKEFRPKFNRYRDLPSEASLPDEGVLKILQRAPPPPVSPEVEANHDENRGEDMESASNSNSQSESGDRTPSSKKVFPLVYRLPSLPPKVLQVLTKGRTEEEKIANQKIVRDDRVSRNLLMACIKTQLDKYTDYPDRHYRTVIGTLLQKYPGLDDEKGTGPGSPDTTPGRTLLDCLKNKYKYRRIQEDKPTETMLQMRAKYGKKKRSAQKESDGAAGTSDKSAETSNDGAAEMSTPGSTDTSASNGESAAKRSKSHSRPLLKLPPNAGVGETDQTCAVHIKCIQKIWNAKDVDYEALKLRMDKTILYRLNLYDKSVDDLLESFPNLADASQILQDGERYYGMDFSTRRKIFLTDERVQILFQKLRGIKKFISNRKQISKESTLDKVLISLPLLLQEKGQLIHVESADNQTVCTLEPCIVIVQGETAEENCYRVFLDRKLLCSNCPDLSTALDVLICAVYLFDIQPSCLQRTHRFIAELIYEVPILTARPVTVQRLVNVLGNPKGLKNANEVSSDECAED